MYVLKVSEFAYDFSLFAFLLWDRPLIPPENTRLSSRAIAAHDLLCFCIPKTRAALSGSDHTCTSGVGVVGTAGAEGGAEAAGELSRLRSEGSGRNETADDTVSSSVDEHTCLPLLSSTVSLALLVSSSRYCAASRRCLSSVMEYC